MGRWGEAEGGERRWGEVEGGERRWGGGERWREGRGERRWLFDLRVINTPAPRQYTYLSHLPDLAPLKLHGTLVALHLVPGVDAGVAWRDWGAPRPLEPFAANRELCLRQLVPTLRVQLEQERRGEQRRGAKLPHGGKNHYKCWKHFIVHTGDLIVQWGSLVHSCTK